MTDMISVRKTISSEDSIIERLQKAIRENDAEELATLLRFAPEFDRNLALNLRTYEAARMCGYDPEVKFDRSGWLRENVVKEKCEQIKHEGKNFSIVISVLQHPNGKWITGHEVIFPTSGSSAGTSIFCDQYDSRTEAMKAEIDSLIAYVETEKEERGHKEAAAVLRRQRASLCQLSLF